MEQCRSCKANVIWTVTEKDGKRMPVDALPVYAGNIVLRDRPGQPPLAIYRKPNDNLKRYISHFVTCPQRKAWRKK